MKLKTTHVDGSPDKTQKARVRLRALELRVQQAPLLRRLLRRLFPCVFQLLEATYIAYLMTTSQLKESAF